MAWLSGWSYRKEITVTGETGAGTDFQVKFNIGDASGGDFHLEGNCTNFPQDIEVTDNDGTTLLKFWIADIAADPLEMTVKVADDLGTNQTIYIYYGKSGATTNSSGTNTFIQYHGSASSNFHDSNVITTPSVIYEARVRHTYAGDESVLWGIGEDGELNAASGDAISIMSHGSSNQNYGKSFNDGTQSYISESPAMVQNQWYRIKIDVISSSSAHLYVDGNEIESGITTNIPNEAVGLVMQLTAGTGEQDWSFVRKYNSPEPAFSSAGSEETSVTQATTLLHGKIRIKDSSTNLADGKLQIQDVDTDLFDGELKVIEKVTSLADGKLQVQDVATSLADGKLQVKDIVTGVADGKVQIQDIYTDLADGKLQVQDVDTDLADGIIQVKDSITSLADGKVQIQDTDIDLADGKVKVQDSATGLADGLLRVQDKATGLTDGKVQIQDTTTSLADGKVQVKDSVTNLTDGKVIVSTVSTATGQVDGKIQIKDVATGIVDGLLKIVVAIRRISIGNLKPSFRLITKNQKPSYRLVAEQPKPTYRLKTENK